MNYQETSRDAFSSFLPASGTLDELIVAAIKNSEQDGITCNAIERVIDRKHQAVSGNLRHLVENGIVKHSGAFGLTDRGRRAMKWILCAAANDNTPATAVVAA